MQRKRNRIEVTLPPGLMRAVEAEARRADRTPAEQVRIAIRATELVKRMLKEIGS